MAKFRRASHNLGGGLNLGPRHDFEGSVSPGGSSLEPSLRLDVHREFDGFTG